MQPLKLTLQAFGPFREKFTISFEELGKNNIYLISGVTGSGKTTIFDAICYALFNTSSGQNRGTTSLKSHYVNDNTESFVELTFIFNNEKYTVIRYPSYERKKTRGEGTIQEQTRAQITLPNGKIIEKVKEVDEYIIELLGINSAQFSQIALLAQGEFLKLLNCDTQNRAEIFRNIFKTWDFARFQNELKDKMIEFKNKHSNLQNSILQYINDTLANSQELSSLKENYTKNGYFNNLDEFCFLLNKQNNQDNQLLLNYKKEIETLEKEIKLNQDMFLEIQTKINLENQQVQTQKELKDIEDTFNGIKKDYQTIETKKKNLQELAIKINNAKNDYQKALEIKELLVLKEKQQSKIIAQKELIKKIELNLEENKINQLKFLINQYITKETELETSQKNFLDLQKETAKAKENYEFNYNEYLKIQAGILAKNLKDNFPCPVCGSTLHPNIAKIKNKTLTKEYLDNLKRNADKLNSDLISSANTCASLKEQVSNLKTQKEKNEKLINSTLEHKKYIIKDIDFEKEIVNLEKTIKNETEIKLNLENEFSVFEGKIETIQKELEIQDIDIILNNHNKLENNYNKLKEEIATIENSFNETNIKLNKLNANIELLNSQLKKYENINTNKLEEITSTINILKEKVFHIDEEIQKIITQKSINEKALSSIKSKQTEFEKIEKTYLNYKLLSDCANGNLPKKSKIPFEQYIQGYYFDMVLFEANKRLKVMSNNQFQLIRKKDITSLQSKTALDLEVMDFHTFKKRSVKTLSGGESFKAALSLALGLSDCVSNFSSINIDTMFIDEGFGSLDSESLELALDVIFNLSLNNKLIGIISHIDDLKTKIQNQIITTKTPHGSTIEVNFN